MSASLVGSEMCIRDSPGGVREERGRCRVLPGALLPDVADTLDLLDHGAGRAKSRGQVARCPGGRAARTPMRSPGAFGLWVGLGGREAQVHGDTFHADVVE
eukprot:9140441-Alexandrium_andersonii.AAC.1